MDGRLLCCAVFDGASNLPPGLRVLDTQFFFREFETILMHHSVRSRHHT